MNIFLACEFSYALENLNLSFTYVITIAVTIATRMAALMCFTPTFLYLYQEAHIK